MFMHHANFRFHAEFNIISANVIFHQLIHRQKTQDTQIVGSFIRLNLLNMTLNVIHIVANKTHMISIFSPDHTTYEIYDGPGFLSERKKLRKSTWKSSSFQCIVTFFKFGKPPAEEAFNFKYSKRNFDVQILPDIPVSFLWKKENETLTNLIVFVSETNKSTNLTFTQFVFVGHDPFDCLFGGLSIFAASGKTLWKQVACHCEQDRIRSRNLQNVYSANEKLLVVLYQYSQYSRVNVALTFSPLNCWPVQVDMCRILEAVGKGQQFELGEGNCLVVQLSTHFWRNEPFADLPEHRNYDYYADSIETTQMCYTEMLKFVKKNISLSRYKFSVEGFLFFSGMIDKENTLSSFIVKGHDFVHEKKKDLSVYEWRTSKKFLMTSAQLAHMYETNKCKSKSNGIFFNECEIYVHSKNNFSKRFHVVFYTHVPTHEDTPWFQYFDLRSTGWVDIEFKEHDKVVVDKGMRIIHVQNISINLGSLKKAEILSLEVSESSWAKNKQQNVEIEIAAKTKVKPPVHYVALASGRFVFVLWPLCVQEKQKKLS